MTYLFSHKKCQRLKLQKEFRNLRFRNSMLRFNYVIKHDMDFNNNSRKTPPTSWPLLELCENNVCQNWASHKLDILVNNHKSSCFNYISDLSSLLRAILAGWFGSLGLTAMPLRLICWSSCFRGIYVAMLDYIQDWNVRFFLEWALST